MYGVFDKVERMIKEFNLNGKKGRITLETEADLSVFEEIFVDKDYRILDKVISV